MAKPNVSLDAPIEVKTLMGKVTTFQKQFMNKFPEPPARTSRAKKSTNPVAAGRKWIQYQKGGPRGYYRVIKLCEKLQTELVELGNSAYYVTWDHGAPAKATKKKRRRRKKK